MKVRRRYYIKLIEFSARCIAWAGALIFVSTNVLEIIKTTNSLLSVVCLWIFLAAFYITGFLDLIHFLKRNLLKNRNSLQQI